MSQAVQCLVFPPYTALPVAPFDVAVGVAPTPLTIPIFGTGPFNVSICGNDAYPSGSPAIASVSLIGNQLTITPSLAQPGDEGAYAAKLCITNPHCCQAFEVPLVVNVT